MKLLSFVLCLAMVFSVSCVGQDAPSAPVPMAPVPMALSHAKKVFVSNAGADSGLFPHPFSGDPDRGYNEFYAQVKEMQRFELVDDPREADLVLELRLHAPSGPANADKQKGASDPLPMFRLVVRDGKSHFVLWAMTESIDRAALQKTHDRNFDDAIVSLVKDLKAVVSRVSSS